MHLQLLAFEKVLNLNFSISLNAAAAASFDPPNEVTRLVLRLSNSAALFMANPPIKANGAVMYVDMSLPIDFISFAVFFNSRTKLSLIHI